MDKNNYPLPRFYFILYLPSMGENEIFRPRVKTQIQHRRKRNRAADYKNDIQREYVP